MTPFLSARTNRRPPVRTVRRPLVRTARAGVLLLAIAGASEGVRTGGGGVSAQSISSPYRFIELPQEVSLYWGPLDLQTGSYDLGPKSGNVMGARYSVEASGPLFIQGMIGYLPTTRDVIDPRRVEGTRAIAETDVEMLMVDARLDFSLTGRRTWNRISPHIFLGGGIAIDLAGADHLADLLLPEDMYDFGTAFTTTSGAGVRLELSSRLMLQAEAGLTLWQINTPAGFDDDTKLIVSDPDTESVVQSEWVRGYGLTVGLGWRF